MTLETVMSEARPRRKSTSTAAKSDHHVDLARLACVLIDDREGESITLAELAEALDVSPWHLQRVFKKVMGISPRDYADAKRAERFRGELKSGESVAGATYGAGYGSSSRVYESAQWQLGMTPASYAKGGKGAHIAYGSAATPLGRLLVATTEKGLCFVCLGESETALLATLRSEFPAADSIEPDQNSIAPAIEQLVAYLAGERPHLDLPLDIQATAFQRRVWQELITIPYGETRSYGEIAARLGLPQGQRAVAGACARNPVPLVVPCHRVVRQNGKLGGYRWGVQRKAKLIATEAAAIADA